MTWINPFGSAVLGGNPVSASSPIIITEPLTITATITAPTKPTTRVLDRISVADNGSGWCTCDLVWSVTNSAGGNNGSGVYIVALPGGYKFDLDAHGTNTQTSVVAGAFTASDQYKSLPQSDGIVSDTSSFIDRVVAVPRTANTFSIVTTEILNGTVPANTFWSAGYWGVASFCRMSFRFKKG